MSNFIIFRKVVAEISLSEKIHKQTDKHTGNIVTEKAKSNAPYTLRTGDKIREKKAKTIMIREECGSKNKELFYVSNQ